MAEQAYQFVQIDVHKNHRLSLALYNTFNTKKGKYKQGKLKSIGEAPHLVDSSLIEISRSQIEKYLKAKGYFNARVRTDIKIKNQCAQITFVADSGFRFKIRNISYEIPDKEVFNLHQSHVNQFTHVHKGQAYDQDSLSYDQEQTFSLLQRNGYFDYLKPYMRVSVDTNSHLNQADLKIFIDNPIDRKKHTIYTINNSVIKIKNSSGIEEGLPDTVALASQYRFWDYSGYFNAKTIKKYLFIKKDEKYNIDKANLTYDRLYALNVFRGVKMDFHKVADSVPRLDVFYSMIPSKKMNNRIEGEYQFNTGRTGFKVADTYSNRNLFGGAELLQLTARYNIQFDAAASGSWFDRVLSTDFNLGASISVPALILFNLPKLGKNGVPHTIFGSNFQFFHQKDKFTNRVFTNLVTYNWAENKYKQHSYTPLGVEYRIGILDLGFITELQNQGNNLFVRTNNRTFINLGSQYTFTYNDIKLRQLSHFFYFKGTLNLAGNTSTLLNRIFNFKIASGDVKTVFGLPYEQYVKTELDFRIYKFLGGDRQLVVRFNPGIGIPYGNSNALTFEKNFFAGGWSGVRAWEARTLGPGGYNRASIGTPVERQNLQNLDQFGEVKLESNLEYRFRLINKLLGATLKGAFFTDFGNVWRFKQNSENPNGEIKLNTFFDQMAIGSGFGLRLDLNYFIIRVDVGVKVKDPQFSGSDQWVISHFFRKQEFKNNYSKTNSPNSYNFLQWNFGIGMPF